jgi:putative peptidoglycan lipid II flippase
VQVGAYVDLVLASLLAAGAVAALGYAQILYLLPISLFAMSVSAAELPELSRAEATPGVAGAGPTLSDRAHVARLEVGLRRIFFFIVFTVVAYLVAGDLIVGALYQRRAFDADDTMLVWLVLCGYTVGLIAVAASRLLQNALFAGGDTKGPAWIAGVRVGLAAVVGVALMFQLDQFAVIGAQVERLGDLPAALHPLPDSVRNDGVVRLGAVGLSLASGLAAWVELALLRIRLRRTLGSAPALAAPVVRLVPAALAAAVVLVGVQFVTDWLPAVLQALVTVGAGGLAYVGVARMTGVAEARTALSSLIRRTR